MGKVRPLGDSTSVELSFEATMSQEFIESYIDENGVKPPDRWAIDFDLQEIDEPALRRRLREAHDRYMAVEPYPELPRISEEPEEFLDAIESWLIRVEKEEEQAEKDSQSAEEAERKTADVFREGMREWVAAHGSRRLKLAVDGGYRANTSYALERSKLEMPGFWLDSASDCEWGERVDPSEEALVLEEAFRTKLQQVDPSLAVRIVWLTETPRALDHKMEEEDLNFEPQEALVVERYLGRYVLVMPLEQELRRNPDEV